MGIASKYNTFVNPFTFQGDSTFDFYPLSELYSEDPEATWIIRAIWINPNTNFGEQPVFTLEDRYVNIPGHMLQNCKDIINDEEAVQQINDGKLGFTIYTYKDKKFGKECYSVTFVDINSEFQKVPEGIENDLPFK